MWPSYSARTTDSFSLSQLSDFYNPRTVLGWSEIITHKIKNVSSRFTCLQHRHFHFIHVISLKSFLSDYITVHVTSKLKDQYSKTNVTHFSVNLVKIKACTCFEYYVLILRSRFTNGTSYIECVLCQLAAPGLEWNGHNTHSVYQVPVVKRLLRMIK
jgi:hypothetical protein